MSHLVSLVFDIQSGSVGGAIIAHDSNQPKIIWNSREEFHISKELSSRDLKIQTLRSLKKITKALFRHISDYKIISMSCFYGAPWHVSKSIGVNIKKTSSFQITNKLLDSVLNKEKEIFLSKIEKENPFGEKVNLINANFTKISLNGYEIEKPLNKKAKELSCNMFLSVIPEKLMHDIELIIHQNIVTIPVNHFVLPLAITSVIKSVMPHDKNFISMIIGEELTEISVIKNKEIQSVITFPHGKNSIIRPTIHIQSPYVTMSMIRVQASRRGSTKNAPEWTGLVTKHIKHAQNQWLDNLEKTLAQLAINIPLPKTILVMSDIDSRLIFAKHLENTTIDTGSGFREKINPIFLHETMLKDFVHNHFFSKPDVFLGSEGVFIHNLLKKNGHIV